MALVQLTSSMNLVDSLSCTALPLLRWREDIGPREESRVSNCAVDKSPSSTNHWIESLREVWSSELSTFNR